MDVANKENTIQLIIVKVPNANPAVAMPPRIK